MAKIVIGKARSHTDLWLALDSFLLKIWQDAARDELKRSRVTLSQAFERDDRQRQESDKEERENGGGQYGVKAIAAGSLWEDIENASDGQSSANRRGELNGGVGSERGFHVLA